MKRGYIFLLAILLIMPFAFAGQVSDFFSYFTNDAFSLVTGAPIGFGVPDSDIGFSPPVPAEDTSAPTTAKKANGAVCTSPGKCRSGVCTRVTSQKSICGKKAGERCDVKSECFSDSCVRNKCGLSSPGKSCTKTADCIRGLSCQNNRCARSAKKAEATQNAKAEPAKEAEESTDIKNEEDILKEDATNTIEGLKARADGLLRKHQASTLSAKKVSLRSALPKLTGNFMLQTLGGLGLPENIVPETSQSSAKKPNGEKCARNSECGSNECYKKAVTNANGLCGKKKGKPCLQNSDCLSSRCTSRLCAISALNKPCLQNSDCSTGNCNENTNKCIARGQQDAKPTATAPLVQKTQQQQTTKITAPGIAQTQKKPATIIAAPIKASVAKKPTATTPGISATQKSVSSEITAPGIAQTQKKPASTLQAGLLKAELAQPSESRSVTPRAISKPTGATCQKSAECQSKLCSCSVGICQVLDEPAAEPAQQDAKKANGETCTANSQCASNYCNNADPRKCAAAPANDGGVTNIEQQNLNLPGIGGFAVLGKQPSITSLKVPAKIGEITPSEAKSCTRDEQCEKGVCVCRPGKGRCTQFKPYAVKIPLPVPAKPATEESKPEATTEIQGQKARFKSIDWECYDGTKLSDQSDSCKTQAEWMDIAKASCEGKCNTDNTKCGINSFSFKDKCESLEEVPAAEVAEEPVAEAQFDLNLAQSVLDGMYARMNALKQKACQEASKHKGIDLGNIKCWSMTP